VDVIELNIEFEPFTAGLGPEAAPPPPTVIGKVAFVIVKPEQAAANGLAV
jgi:hypothetical protein